jgi:His/Glu/Gln/Arg/opine family amino acid ABC transporter permease subunit
MGFEYFLSMFPQLAYGAWLTVEISVICWIVGNSMALGVALLRTSKNPFIWIPAHGYIQLFRSTPFLVQLYIIYYGCGNLLPHLRTYYLCGDFPHLEICYVSVRDTFLWPYLRDAFWYGVIALSLNTAAYSGNILRGAIEAVPFGEIEAGRAFGMSKWLILRRVILPRAIRICLPAMSGETILLMKTTALLSTVTILDLMGTARFIVAQTFRVYEPLLAAACLYIVLTFIITRGFRYLEAYLNKDRLEPIQIKTPLPIEVA